MRSTLATARHHDGHASGASSACHTASCGAAKRQSVTRWKAVEDTDGIFAAVAGLVGKQ
jgi:hypothetical protein